VAKEWSVLTASGFGALVERGRRGKVRGPWRALRPSSGWLGGVHPCGVERGAGELAAAQSWAPV
jgi:hypothetical protein